MKRILWGLLVFSGTTFGADWMQWRGPELSGTCNAENLPTTWSVEGGKNISRNCTLPGTGSSMPIVVGRRIFLTPHAENDQLYTLCIDRTSGKVNWKKKVGSGEKAMRGNTMASPSAVSDGETVWFIFGQGSLAAFSLEGKLIWKRELEQKYGMFNQKFGFSASPLMHAGRLYIPMLFTPKEADSGRCLVSIDGQTGKTQWTAERPTEATKESLDSYTTPILGKNGIILTGADLVTCHDLSSGKEKWRLDIGPENERRTGGLLPVRCGPMI